MQRLSLSSRSGYLTCGEVTAPRAGGSTKNSAVGKSKRSMERVVAPPGYLGVDSHRGTGSYTSCLRYAIKGWTGNLDRSSLLVVLILLVVRSLGAHVCTLRSWIWNIRNQVYPCRLYHERIPRRMDARNQKPDSGRTDSLTQTAYLHRFHVDGPVASYYSLRTQRG